MFDKQTRVLRKFSELNLGFSDLTTKFMLKDEFSESLFQVCYQTPFDYVMLSSNETDSKERWVDSMSMRLSSENENEICFFEGNLSKDKIKYLNLIVSKSVYAGACAIQGNTLVLRNCEPDLYSQVFDYIVSFFASFNWLYFIRKATSEQNRHIPKALLKLFSDIPRDASGDVFGQIYEYFLSNFALKPLSPSFAHGFRRVLLAAAICMARMLFAEIGGP